MRYVIAYDIGDDGRRSRVAETLEACGRRVQYSVFECELDRRELETLLEGLDEIVVPGVDRVRLYRLCRACAGEIESLGAGSSGLDPEVWIV